MLRPPTVQVTALPPSDPGRTSEGFRRSGRVGAAPTRGRRYPVRIHVRRHKRVTVTGRTVTVRAHRARRRRRDAAGAGVVPAGVRGEVPASSPPHAADFWDDDAAPDTEGIWADDGEDMSPAFAVMVAQDPGLGGEKFRRLKALRDSGYAGPVDQDGGALTEKSLKKDQAAAMARFQRAPTVAERDAAEADYERARPMRGPVRQGRLPAVGR